MDIPQVSLPGYRINEYRLVVPLPQSIREKIESVRDKLHERHRVKQSFHMHPSLTLLRFHAFEKTEARLIERFEQVTMGCHPFLVQLQDFSAYPSHTIYINIPTRSPFNDLCKELKKMRWLMNIQGREPQFINEPHLIIAQALKPMQFISMWLECEHASFDGKVLAEQLLLMKRVEGGYWEDLRPLQFRSLPSAIKQGELFS
jgi:2'-5' RNA ligase